ncbi:hypothetical protein C8J56DRAFT_1055670 [Mycena floridula]|nr:hypothetical protein C8J56DRAFT_1055670 [Mycena floridula]
MSIHDSRPALVAPRPLRLSSMPQIRAHQVRMVSGSEGSERAVDDLTVGILETTLSEKNDLSPRSSPRFGLASGEADYPALEEFLSILRPPFFPPSPRPRRQMASVPNYPPLYRGMGRLELIQKTDGDGSEMARSASPGSLDDMESTDFEYPDVDDIPAPFRWFSSNVLSSPISRNNTRNPFQRNVHHLSPSPILTSLSPSAVPLPLPTPDEV